MAECVDDCYALFEISAARARMIGHPAISRVAQNAPDGRLVTSNQQVAPRVERKRSNHTFIGNNLTLVGKTRLGLRDGIASSIIHPVAIWMVIPSSIALLAHAIGGETIHDEITQQHLDVRDILEKCLLQAHVPHVEGG